jgi:hypothetical protein
MGIRCAVVLLAAAPACERSRPAPAIEAHAGHHDHDETPVRSSEPAASSSDLSCAGARRVEQLAPGLTLETLRPKVAPAVAVADTCLRVLRADPEHFDVELGAAADAPLTGPEWAERTGAVGVINASMYLPDGRSTGLLVDGDRALTPTVNDQFGAFFAAGPRTGGGAMPAATMWGDGCPGSTLAELRRDYRLIVQNYRLLDCEGKPIAWKDEKVYSAAAVGLDRDGNVLFIHSRAPYRMASFTQLLVDPALGLELVAAMYVEGGPEATLAVRTAARTAVFVGSYETQFVENDANEAPWDLPNVLLLVNR